MAHNKLYRNFIILQEDEKTHAASGEKALSGYAKIEVKNDKCKISFYAQNLKVEERYSIVLICYKKDMKQIVDLGSLTVKDSGKGEISKEYYVNNIGGINLSYEKISGAAVCKHKEGKIHYLMYGFMNGEHVKDDWKKCKVVKHSDGDEIVKVEKKIETKKIEPKKVEEKNDCCELEVCKEKKKEKCPVCDSKEKEEKHDKEKSKDKCHEYAEDKHDKEKYKDKCHEYAEDKHDKEKYKDKYHECEEEKYDKDKYKGKCLICDGKEDKKKYCKVEPSYKNCDDYCYKRGAMQADFDAYESRIEEEKKLDPYNFNLRGGLGQFFSEVADGFEEVRHKIKEIKYCKWYRIKIKSIEDMCNSSDYNKYTIAYYPMINYFPYIKKYGYYMLGYKCDKKGEVKYLVYGIPGKKDKDEQPFMGKTGFVTWINTGQGDVGCWLMFYDFKKSTVVVPMK